jgi:dTDP-4-dehydrorhamnose 3,5-epimerase-like enzyme
VAVELTAEKRRLYVPEQFAHGDHVLQADIETTYDVGRVLPALS